MVGLKRSTALGVAVLAAAAGSLVGSAPAQAAFAPAAAIQIKVAHSNKCLNVKTGGTDNDLPIVQYNCGTATTFPNDKFRVRPMGAGTFQIISNSSNKCLNVYKAAVVNDTPVHQYTCADTAANNLWSFVPVVGKPTFRIKSKQSGKCLNISKGLQDINTPAIIYTCTTATTPTNDQFYFPPATSPTPVPAAVTPGSRMSVVQSKPTGAQVGALVYSYVDAGGQLRRAYQPDPSVFNNLTFTAPAGLEQFAGRPAMNVQADGKVYTTMRNAEDGDLWQITQSDNKFDQFGPSVDVGGAGVQQPVVGKLPDGKLVTFAVVGGSMWHLPQDGTNTPYGAWRQIGGSGLVGEPTVVTIRDGLRLFSQSTNGTVLTAAYRNGALSDWVSLGQQTFVGAVSAAVFPGYRVRVVARDAAGHVFTKVETATDTFEPAWSQVGDFVTVGTPAVVMDQSSGVAAIVARGTDNTTSVSWENGPSSKEFLPWEVRSTTPASTDPAIVSYDRGDGTSAVPAWGWSARNLNDVPFFVTVTRDAAAGLRATSERTAGASFTEHQFPAPTK